MTNGNREQRVHDERVGGQETRPDPQRANGRGSLATRERSEESGAPRPADERRPDERRPDERRPEERRPEERRPDERGPSADAQPDVLLDVPEVKVDEINLEVEDLRARVSLQSEVLDLLRLNVGADVLLGRVHLEIKGVEAQALLKVRLDHVAQMVERVLTTIDNNPQILEHIAKGAGAAVQEVGGGAGQAAGEIGRGAGSAVEDVGGGARQAVGEVGGAAGEATKDLGGAAGETAKETGKGAGEAVGEAGKAAGTATGETGKAAGSAAGGLAGGLSPTRLAAGIARTGMKAGRDGLRWLKNQTDRIAGDGASPDGSQERSQESQESQARS